MKTSIIRQRVADFLRQHAPFDSLSRADLLELAGSGRVKFHSCEEYVFQQGDTRSDLVWVVQQGRLEVLAVNNGAEVLEDVMGAGDVLGLDGLVGNGRARTSMRTATDVILYGLNGARFEALAQRYPEVDRFLKARYSMAGWEGSVRHSWLDAEAPPESFLRARKNRAGDREGLMVVDGPVATRQAVMAMLRNEAYELEVNGVGRLTSADLALFCGQNAVGLVGELRAANSAEELKPLLGLAGRMVDGALGSARDMEDCRELGGLVMQAVATACVRMARREANEAGIVAPKVPYCVVMFGSAARGDRPHQGFPTIAFIYDDERAAPETLDQFYFVSVAGMAGHWMHRSGLEGEGMHWPRGMQPSMPLSEWKRLYRETIGDPLDNAIFERRGFFDLALLEGDSGIFAEVRGVITKELAESSIAVAMLANDTMGHVPPLTFFEGLVVELDGAQKECFDIELVLVRPVADAARVFAMAHKRVQTVSTLERLKSAALDYPDEAQVFADAAEAFRVGLYHLTLAGDKTIYPRKLAKADQILLKTAIRSVGRLLELTVNTFVGRS